MTCYGTMWICFAKPPKYRARRHAIAFGRPDRSSARKRPWLLIDAIADGVRAPGLQAQLNNLENRKSALERNLAAAPPAIHPNMAEVYRQKVADLQAALVAGSDGTEALRAARALIERVVLHPS